MNIYLILADAIIVFHFLYIMFVLGGQLAIMIGWPLGWKWIRNPWFRCVHLAMILVVAGEAVVDFECPLTTWELQLRRLGEPDADHLNTWDIRERSFTARLIRGMMYYDYSWENVLAYSYYVVAGVVLATVFLVPPHFRRRRAASTLAHSAAATTTIGMTSK